MKSDYMGIFCIVLVLTFAGFESALFGGPFVGVV